MSGQDLISPSVALRAAVFSAYAHFRDTPKLQDQGFGSFAHRVGEYYASRATRDASELMVGYLHHEDPRFRRSIARSFLGRTQSAFLNVMTSPDQDGNLRVAYAPIAGSLSAAAVGGAMYRHHETLDGVLTHAGWIYSRYFLRAMYMEFRPEMTAFTRHMLRRDKN